MPGEGECVMVPETTTTVLLIAGMRGIGCGQKIASALGAVKGVGSALVDFWSARATIIHHAPCNTSQLIGAVQAAGYSASLAGTVSGDGMWSGSEISGWSDEANPWA
jgi:copper chaperone CopZ